MCGCDRESTPPTAASKDRKLSQAEAQTPSRQKLALPLASTMSPELDEKAWEAIKEATRPETLQQGTAKLRVLADSLVKANKLAQTLARLGPPQSNDFADLVVPVFESKRAQQEYDLEYFAALKVLNESPSRPKSEDLIEDLDRVPAYVFPIEAPNPWDVANAVHQYKGYPGQIALALVSRTDAQTQSLYRQKLSQTSGSLRAVMLWALGHSQRKETFDYLLSMYPAASGDERSLIVRSMNRIPVSIEQAATTSTDPVQKESLIALMSELRRQLREKRLNVELTTWD